MGDTGPSDGSVLCYGISTDSFLSAFPKLHDHTSGLCCIAPLSLGTEDKGHVLSHVLGSAYRPLVTVSARYLLHSAKRLVNSASERIILLARAG